MEMEFKDGSRRRRPMIILGVVLAVVAGLTAYSMGSGGAAPAEAVPMRTILVAAQELPARSIVLEADVTTREVTDDSSVSLAMTSPADVVGRVTVVPILPGQVIYPNMLVSTSADAAFSILGPSEIISEGSPLWRAVSVLVPSDRAVAGQILAGQRVDLFSTVQIDILTQTEDGKFENVPSAEGFLSGKSTKITFQDLEVLDAQPDEDLYVLKVDLHQAEEISHIAAVAPNSFSLALRPDGDTRSADATEYGETNDRIIVQYLFPVPQIIDLGGMSGIGTGVPPAEPVPGEEEPTEEPGEASPAPVPASPSPDESEEP
jgi:Flp pilus assembly protein CpaB